MNTGGNTAHSVKLKCYDISPQTNTSLTAGCRPSLTRHHSPSSSGLSRRLIAGGRPVPNRRTGQARARGTGFNSSPRMPSTFRTPRARGASRGVGDPAAARRTWQEELRGQPWRALLRLGFVVGAGGWRVREGVRRACWERASGRRVGKSIHGSA